jgi:hypothetical protein
MPKLMMRRGVTRMIAQEVEFVRFEGHDPNVEPQQVLMSTVKG